MNKEKTYKLYLREAEEALQTLKDFDVNVQSFLRKALIRKAISLQMQTQSLDQTMEKIKNEKMWT
jgi:hypothetical protein